ncbi:hypothetical protein MUTS15_45150 [Escherichia coli]|nr:hypothetical protein MUTS15_45150 [Escherichia coli]BDZ04420.1 hypothetical protein MUTS16_54930 [Escherichia coli]
MAVQDIRVGGRQANASYQYTLLSDDLAALREWEPKIRKNWRHCQSWLMLTPIRKIMARR